ncbi:MAG: tRNA (N6-threonylcarbamoyladenosine(37)-N6)-methyltransferase TrmO [Chloroflexota bacterium]
MQTVVQMQPIGRVSNPVAWGQKDVRWEEIVSRVTLFPRWAEGLEGIDEFSHIMVIFYLDRARKDGVLNLRTRPMGRKELPEVGIFATRSPFRPNGIGVTTVELLARDGAALRVRGLDAYDGTPVLDVKPYLSRGDEIQGARMARWAEQLWQMLDQEHQEG